MPCIHLVMIDSKPCMDSINGSCITLHHWVIGVKKPLPKISRSGPVYITFCVRYVEYFICDYSQKSLQPLPPAEVNAIWEKCKDMGILLGKGGLAGNVSCTVS